MKKVTDEEHKQLQYLRLMEKWDEILSEMRIKPTGIAEEIKGGNEEGVDYYEVEAVSFPEDGGTYTHYRGYELPKKGFTDGKSMAAIDKVKRTSSILLHFVSKYWWAIILTPWRTKYALEHFIRSNWAHVQPYLLKEKRYCDAVREVRRVGKEVGIDSYALDIISILLEYDDAYRYRFQFASRYLSNGDNSFSAVRKFFTVLERRERSTKTKRKWAIGRRFSWLIALVFRKQIRAVLDEVVLERIVLSEEDWCWVQGKELFDFDIHRKVLMV